MKKNIDMSSLWITLQTNFQDFVLTKTTGSEIKGYYPHPEILSMCLHVVIGGEFSTFSLKVKEVKVSLYPEVWRVFNNFVSRLSPSNYPLKVFRSDFFLSFPSLEVSVVDPDSAFAILHHWKNCVLKK